VKRIAGEDAEADCKKYQQFSFQKDVCEIKRNLQYERRAGPVRFPGRRMAGSQNGRLSWPCGIGGNFGFRGPIGSSGLEFFVSFWGNAKKNKPG
jgi:hypothetical protein